MIKTLIILLSFLFLFSCGRELSYDQMIEYIGNPTNGLKKEKVVNSLKYIITYKPSSMVLYQNSKVVKSGEKKLPANKNITYKYYYFILNLSMKGRDPLYNGSNNFQDFSQKFQALSFHLDDFINITTEKDDTIRIADYNTPNFYGVGNATQILFAFEKPKTTFKEFKITVKDLGFNTGSQNFIFRKEDIENAPLLIF